MGRSGGLSENVTEKIQNYNSFFSSQDADILFLQEFTEYIDSNNIYNSDNSIFNSYFPYISHFEKETEIKSKTAISNSYFSYLHTSGDFPAWCIYGNTVINEKTITLVSAVLNSSSNINEKIRALTKLTTVILPNSKNVIIGMDTNALSESEANTIKSFMENKGFNCANWNKFGYLNTYNLSSSMYKSIDNIFVRGDIKINNFYVPDVYNYLSSDHFPVVAELTIFKE